VFTNNGAVTVERVLFVLVKPESFFRVGASFVEVIDGLARSKRCCLLNDGDRTDVVVVVVVVIDDGTDTLAGLFFLSARFDSKRRAGGDAVVVATDNNGTADAAVTKITPFSSISLLQQQLKLGLEDAVVGELSGDVAVVFV
jgi:hypothetical protein